MRFGQKICLDNCVCLDSFAITVTLFDLLATNLCALFVQDAKY